MAQGCSAAPRMERWAAGSICAGAGALGQAWAGQHRSRSPAMLLLAPECGCPPALIISPRVKLQGFPGAGLFGVGKRAERCPVQGKKRIAAVGMQTNDGKQLFGVFLGFFFSPQKIKSLLLGFHFSLKPMLFSQISFYAICHSTGGTK